jgi:hypothetical protein
MNDLIRLRAILRELYGDYRTGGLKRLSHESGVHMNTLGRIMNGETTPQNGTVVAILQAYDARVSGR